MDGFDWVWAFLLIAWLVEAIWRRQGEMLALWALAAVFFVSGQVFEDTTPPPVWMAFSLGILAAVVVSYLYRALRDNDWRRAVAGAIGAGAWLYLFLRT